MYLNDTFHGALIPCVIVAVCLSNHMKVPVTGKVVEFWRMNLEFIIRKALMHAKSCDPHWLNIAG